jgi:seryl-tRNA synthetase
MGAGTKQKAMIDLKLVREQLESLSQRLKTRGYQLDTVSIQSLEQNRRDTLQKQEKLQMRRNQLAKAIAESKKAGNDSTDLMHEAADISKAVKLAEQESKDVDEQLTTLLSDVPNLPHASVPHGDSEQDNVVVRSIGEPTRFDFPIKDHESLCEQNNEIDCPTAAKLAGSRFTLLKGDVSRLHRALSQWMMDVHTQQHDYLEMNVPVLASPKTLYGTGQLPKFREDLFVTNDERELMLIPTAEVQLVNCVADQIIDEARLPLAYCAHSLCFRKEAGSYGKDTKGIFRVHQFEKVELVRIVEPEQSYDALETITNHAENILKALALPYRVVSLCTGDLGFAAAKTYDIEVWIPSQNTYREISSCSNTEDFQTRRTKTRYKNAQKKSVLLHALNGSGVAVGRLLIAVLENYQQEDGTVLIPDMIRPYMGNSERILG